jgi:TRAP-type C4-dicarboxylate transport system permease small subunit
VKGLLRILDLIEGALAALAILLLCAVTLSVCLEVLMRYGFNSPLIWVVEIGEYALLYITFLGTAWALKNGSHVRVDIILGLFSQTTRRVLGVISSSLGVIISIVLTVCGILVTWDKFASHAYKPTVVEFPTWIVVIVIPIGSFFLGVRFLRILVEYWTGERVDRTEAEEAAEG